MVFYTDYNIQGFTKVIYFVKLIILKFKLNFRLKLKILRKEKTFKMIHKLSKFL